MPQIIRQYRHHSHLNHLTLEKLYSATLMLLLVHWYIFYKQVRLYIELVMHKRPGLAFTGSVLIHVDEKEQWDTIKQTKILPPLNGRHTLLHHSLHKKKKKKISLFAFPLQRWLIPTIKLLQTHIYFFCFFNCLVSLLCELFFIKMQMSINSYLYNGFQSSGCCASSRDLLGVFITL